MNDLHILIARLGWPSTSTRWWAMQELATCLAEHTTKAATEAALFELLHERKLEAEVIEVLCIFWIAAKGFGYVPPEGLASAIPKPSLLATLLMASLGFAIEDSAGDLVQLPQGFEVSQDFGGVQGVDLPGKFLSHMRWLEHQTDLPFVAQMAFEWSSNHAAYPDTPYQGDAGHFLRPIGDGFSAHLSARTALRAISAYLRALGVGKHLWRMPATFAEELSLLALPVHPTLAFLRPRRPDWYSASGLDFSRDLQTTETSLKSLLAHIEQARPGDELIAFSSPVLVSMGLCIEVSMVRWSQVAGGNIADADLAAQLQNFWSSAPSLFSSAAEPFNTTTSVWAGSPDQLIDKESASWPLAGFLDFDRMGYLQLDLYPKRLFVPTLNGTTSVEMVPSRGQLEVRLGAESIADLCYWNAGWGPVHPSQLGGNCGTALISRGVSYREVRSGSVEPTRSFYLWQVRKLHRKDDYGEFNEELTSGVMFV